MTAASGSGAQGGPEPRPAAGLPAGSDSCPPRPPSARSVARDRRRMAIRQAAGGPARQGAPVHPSCECSSAGSAPRKGTRTGASRRSIARASPQRLPAVPGHPDRRPRRETENSLAGRRASRPGWSEGPARRQRVRRDHHRNRTRSAEWRGTDVADAPPWLRFQGWRPHCSRRGMPG